MNNKLKQGNIYAVHHGDYAGQMIVYIMQDKKEQRYNFLALPDMKTLKINQIDFDDGIKNGLVKFVEKAPRHVVKVIASQYKKNENI
jgi:hypothetical protein